MKSLFRFFALTLWTACIALGARAESAPAQPETVIVPYDSHKPLAGQRPDQLYVPYERFTELWDAAKKNRRGPEPEKADDLFLLKSSYYEGTLLDNNTVSFRGVIELNTFSPWVTVPLRMSLIDQTAESVGSKLFKLDGVTAAFDADNVIIEKPGRHTVEIVFNVLLSPGAKYINFTRIPRTPATWVSMVLPRPEMHAWIDGCGGTVEQTVNGQRIVTASLGGESSIWIHLDASTTLSRIDRPAVARLHTQLLAGRAVDMVQTHFDFSFPAAKQERFVVFLDKNATLVDLNAANLKSWKLIREADLQVLEVQLNEPVKEQFGFTVTCEQKVGALTGTSACPFFTAAAQRVEHEASLFSAEGLTLTPRPAAGFRQIPGTGEKAEGFQFVGTFAWSGLLNVTDDAAKRPKPQPEMLLAYETREAASKREAQVNYVYQVDRRKVELIASLNLRSKGQFTAALRIPTGFELQAVQGADVADSWQEGDTLHVRFKKAVQEDSPLVVYLVRRYPSAPDKLELTPLTLRDFDTIHGEAVIAAHKGVKVSLQLSPEAKEIDPETAAKDFSILPPMERKRAFSFKNQAFSGSVAMEALPVRMNSTWVMAARVNEGWISLSTRLQTVLRQGSIDALSFTLPASIPEARVSGPEIREVTSKVEGDRRRYNVVFHNSVYDAVEFTADVDLAAVEKAGITVPSLEIDGMERTSGFVLVDNASESEMRIQPTGLEVARREEIPFLPDLSQSATLFRTQPGWSLKIATAHLEKSASRAAFVAWAEITTAFRPDGTEWNRAVYHLQNRSLQFLPVKLPAGAELVGAQVAGQPVRADAGQVEKQEAVLVPLIKTQQGDLSYNVELVYRMTARKPLGMLTQRTLHDPSLVGITVEKTLWNLWLPEDRSLFQASGNMTPVLDEVNRTEKMQGTMDELKSLASIIRSEKVSRKSQAAAVYNYEKLSKALESDAKEALDSAKDSRQVFNGLNVKKQDAAKQQLEVSQQAGTIQSELKKEAQEVQQLKQVRQREFQVAREAEKASVGKDEGKNWASNKGYITTAETATQKPKMAQPIDIAGNNLIINDNVVLQQPSNVAVTSGSLTLQGGNTYTGNVALNTARANAFAGQIQITGGKMVAKAAMDQNGAAVAQSEVQQARPQTQLRSANSLTALNNDAFADKSAELSSHKALAADAAAAAADEAASAGDSPQSPEDAKADGKAVDIQNRLTSGNRSGVGRGGAISANAIDSLLYPPQDAGAPGSPGVSGAAGPVAHATPPASASARPDGAFSDIDQLQAQVPAEPQLKPTGRVSLSVDFPTEGQVFHFKKLKANATLDLWINRPPAFARWKWAFGFLLIGGVLAFVSIWMEKRRAAM